MTLEEKCAILNRIEQLMYQGRFEELGELVHPDFIVFEDFGMPYGGIYRGPDGFAELVSKVVATWDGLQTECLSLLDEPGGDGVLMVMRLTGRSHSSGRTVEAQTSEFWRISNGRLAEGRVWYFDTPTVAAALAGENEGAMQGARNA